jgi:threonine/homoserine/homoserine lactone efflux protein
VAGVASRRKTIWLQGLASTAFNPKFGAFVVVFFPEFIDPTNSVALQTALLGAIYLVIDLVWMVGWGMTVVAVGESLMSDAMRCWLQRICGVVLLLFAVLLITTPSQ